MKTICDATQSPAANVRAAAYECLVLIAFQYYDKLQSYMQTLFQLTFATIRSDEETVALQAIEFWSTLAEEEMELIKNAVFWGPLLAQGLSQQCLRGKAYTGGRGSSAPPAEVRS